MGTLGPSKSVLFIAHKPKWRLTSRHRMVTDADTKAVLSSLSTKSGGYMRGWGTACECQRDCAGTVETHYYTDTVITFKSPEPGFKLGASQGASFTPPQSEEGGRVWKVAKMTIPAMVSGGDAGGKGRGPKGPLL